MIVLHSSSVIIIWHSSYAEIPCFEGLISNIKTRTAHPIHRIDIHTVSSTPIRDTHWRIWSHPLTSKHTHIRVSVFVDHRNNNVPTIMPHQRPNTQTPMIINFSLITSSSIDRIVFLSSSVISSRFCFLGPPKYSFGSH